MPVIRRTARGETQTRSISFQDVWGSGSDVFGAGTKAGIPITNDTALQSTTVYRCISILAENIATLPLDQFIRRDGVKRPYRPRAYWLDFNTGPFNKIDLISQMMFSLLTDGNSYNLINRDTSGRIAWMEPLNPDMVHPRLVNGRRRFMITLGNGRTEEVGPGTILHIPGLVRPGEVEGISPIKAARETIGLSLASTQFGSALFGNGLRPSMVAEVDGSLSPEGAASLRRSVNEVHQGVGSAGKLLVATEGIKLKPMSISPDDGQFLATRQFQVVDIARLYGVPAHLLAHADAPQFGTNVAEQNVAFVQHSLRPWIERIEQGLSDAERTTGISDPAAFISLNVNGLMRGDYSRRMAATTMATREGIITINEARAEEDLPPVEWGDTPISVQVQNTAGDAPQQMQLDIDEGNQA